MLSDCLNDGAQVPVEFDLLYHGAQLLPEIVDGPHYVRGIFHAHGLIQRPVCIELIHDVLGDPSFLRHFSEVGNWAAVGKK